MELAFIQPEVKLVADFHEKEENSKLLGNNLRFVSFSCRTSMLFRDLLMISSPGGFSGNIEYSRKTLKFSSEYKGISDQFLFDQAKIYNPKKSVHVPMAASVEYIISMKYDILLDFLDTLRKHNSDLWSLYGNLFLSAIGEDESFLQDREDSLVRFSVGESEYKHLGQSNPIAGIVAGIYRLSNRMVAHVASQSCLMVHGELFNKINQKSLSAMIYEMTSDLSVIALYMSKPDYMNAISCGCCFLSSWDKESADSWSAISGAFVARGDSRKFLGLLPCRGSAELCTKTDENLKLSTGELVGIPCPIALEYPQLVSYRKMKRSSEGVISDKWQEIAASIRDNPKNLIRTDYIRKVMSHENILPITEAVKKAVQEEKALPGVSKGTSVKASSTKKTTMKAASTDYVWGEI